MAEVEDIYGLSPLQEGMLFHSLYAPESGTYVEQRWCVIEGALDIEAFQTAWKQVVNRHAALRSEFHWEETEQPVQVVYDEVSPEWVLESNEPFEDFLQRDRERGFSLDRAPLIRFALFPQGSDRHRFVWTFHHVLMDGWGNGVLIREVLAYYEAAKSCQAIRLPEPMSYKGYIDWFDVREADGDTDYWRGVLEGFERPVELASSLKPIGGSEAGYADRRRRVDTVATKMLEEAARRHHLTLNTLVQGAWAVLLNRYTSENDVLFGATISGRPTELEGVESAIGLFINTVPVRVGIDDNQSVVDWLGGIQREQRNRETHGFSRLLELQSFTGVPSGVPLFESLIVFENYPISIDAVLERDTAGLKLVERDGFERTNYPLTLIVLPGEELEFSFRFETDRFSEAAIDRLAAQLEVILKSFAGGMDQPMAELDLLGDDERKRLEELGRGEEVSIDAPPIHQRFSDQAKANPDRLVLTVPHAGEEVSYADLDRDSSRLAAWLSGTHKVGKGARVGVFLRRTSLLPLGLLGVLKAGAAYVPLDRDFPANRLQYMAKDAELEVILFDGDETEVAEVFGEARLARLDRATLEGNSGMCAECEDDDLAYIIYTSGSTGDPKGVAITHGNLSNFLTAMERSPGMCRDDVLLAITTVSFDIAALELFLPLSVGGRIVLASSDEARDGEALLRLIRTQEVNVMQATPATWRLLVECLDDLAGFPCRIFCGGEALDVFLARKLIASGQPAWNLYGPTETTIWSGALQLTEGLLAGGNVPVGAPILNTQLRVVDANGRLVPAGGVGELQIGGLGLSPGYWRRDELTRDRFRDGFYRTGDSVRLRDDGLFEFIGRMDGQIKLRGFRIELGEIEAVLNAIPEIAQGIAIVRETESAEKELVAFVRLRESGANQSVDRWRSEMRSQLPDYMVPARIEVVDDFPKTLNEKIDRRALASLALSSSSSPEATGRFDSPNEEIVAGIWSEVLGRPVTSGEDHFFELGGHSLSAARVVGRVREALGCEVELRRLFERPRLREFVAGLGVDDGQCVEPIPRVEANNERLPLSPAQRRQWLMVGLLPLASLYTIPTAVTIRGKLSRERLEASLQKIAGRHDMLRMSFHEEGGEPFAKLHDKIDVALEWAESADDLDAEINRRIREPIALENAPLWQATAFKVSANEHVVVLMLHHILADGWSMGILVRDLAAAYEQEESGKAQLRYVDHVAWQEAQDTAGDLDYWREQLRGLPLELNLPTDLPRPSELAFAGGNVDFELSSDDLAALRQIGQQAGTTLFMTLFAAFNVLLQRYSDENDIAIGTPVANRPRPELESIIGLFVNTVVLRTKLGGNPTFGELLTQVRQTTLDAYRHQSAGFEEVVDALGVARSRSNTPLFQVLFTLQNAPWEPVQVSGLEWSPMTLEPGTAKFDLSVSMREEIDGLTGRIEYRSDLFLPETIGRFAKHFVHLIRSLPDQIEQPLSALSVLPADDRALVMRWGNASACKPLAESATIHERFQQQAKETPNALAVVRGDESLSYRELDAQSDRLASALRGLGVGCETPVGVVASRAPETMVILLGILKAGGAYVPLDADLPRARVELMLADAQIGIVLGAEADALVSWLPDSEPDEMAELGAFVARTNTDVSGSTVDASSASMAYVIYTSGSTGIPKGVATPHRGVLRLVRDTDFMSFSSQDVYLQAAPLGFDASTLEVWGALLNGAKVVLPDSGFLALEEIVELVESHSVTTLWLTAGLFHLMVDEQFERLRSVKQLLAGGDVLSLPHLGRAHALAPQTQLINGYGPTEGTTFTCCHSFTDDELNDWQIMRTVPIGNPIANTSVYVLDSDLNPTPVGVPGELYLGGLGLARGYVNQPATTAERFVPNPFFDFQKDAMVDENLTLYRTGDRVRWRADGAIEFLGRIDEQVKVRGFRVEPGEIETALKTHSEINDAVVATVAGDGGHKQLVAYLTGETQEVGELRSHLMDSLPVQFVPAHYVWLDALPVTPNGKIDRSALPEPDWSRAENAADRKATEREEQIQAIWASLLPVQDVGLDDNFFELGGDSIMALQIVSRMKRVGLETTPAMLFQHQTVAELAQVVTSERKLVPAELREPSGNPFKPTPIQCWFDELGLVNPNHFNQAICIVGPAGMDREALDLALSAVVRHHDALRLRKRQGVYEYAAIEPVGVEWHDGESPEELAPKVHASLDLKAGPVFRAVGLRDAVAKEETLLLVAHHLVVDGVSWRILMEDLQDAYRQARRKREIVLPPKTANFEAWSAALCKSVERAEQDADYWEAIAASAQSLTPPEAGESEVAQFDLTEDETRKLLVTEERNETLARLLTAFVAAVQHKSGDSQLTIDLEGHGREGAGLGCDLDVSRTVGWFTSVYPVNLSGDHESIKRELERVPSGGLSYGVLRHLAGRESVRVPSQVAFNYLGQLDGQTTEGFRRTEVPGPAVDPANGETHAITVNCWIANGRLSGEWRSPAAGTLAAGFRDELANSLADDSSGVSPFDLAGLNADQLAQIAGQISFGGDDDE